MLAYDLLSAVEPWVSAVTLLGIALGGVLLMVLVVLLWPEERE